MPKNNSVPLSKIVKENTLQIIHMPTDYDNINIFSEDVNRPGLQLGGFYDYFVNTRLQIIGMAENAFLNGLMPEKRLMVFEKFFSKQIPALIYSRGIEPHKECLLMAEKYDTAVLSSNETTSNVVSKLVTGIKTNIAPTITRHGVLVEVYGEGVLIVGDSGIGKSESAIELVKRGHRLIADDAVEISRTAENLLIGSSPELIRHYMEIRGIGVVNIKSLFGTGAVRDYCNIDMIVSLEQWDDTEQYDRLGTDWKSENIMDVKISRLSLPVKPGRNMAAILEVAAMTHREKKMGYNAAAELSEKISGHIYGLEAEGN